jgi:hypothetical protein
MDWIKIWEAIKIGSDVIVMLVNEKDVVIMLILGTSSFRIQVILATSTGQ